MAKETYWKVWLTPNRLTKDIENDFVAEVSTAGSTIHNKDIAARVVAERSELRLETIMSILTARDEIVRKSLLQGTAVQDGCVRMSPRVSGAWLGASRAFDPKVHKLGVDASLTADMRAALETVGVEVLGEKEGAGYIALVTDIATGRTDGAITPDEDILITGDKIKIAPEDESGLGVFFVDESGVEHPVTHKITENLPKKLIVRVPALAAGSYTLKIITRFSSAKTLVQDPRAITYALPLAVVVE
ncbi:MAG: DUF4469 domain-containing protein [Treponema sp.]|jgi:hypothetical protein|nr:DUF4469 domain-containing protein [Treponema sp.]